MSELSDFEDPVSEPRRTVKFPDNVSDRSGRYSNADSVATQDLFTDGQDKIIYQGELMKFKPGLSCNFVSRYV